MLLSLILILLKMENPFEIILEKLDAIQKELEQVKASAGIDGERLLSRAETCELLKINETSLWKHTKSGRLTSYGLGNRIYYKKKEVMDSIICINKL